MAGHSKWANIKHRKGAQDAKRGKIFTKLIKEIIVATKLGGPDPESNPRLRLAIQNGRAQNLPKDNIERAIKKASGDDDGNYNEVIYEGYGPHGVAVYVECTTDNLNRTVANVRSYFNKFDGSLSKHGSLDFIFDQKGVFSFKKPEMEEDELELELIEGGAEEIEKEDDIITVYCQREDFGNMQNKLEELNIDTNDAGLQRIPITTKNLSVDEFRSAWKMIELIEDDDDVQKVFHNIELTEDLMAELEG